MWLKEVGSAEKKMQMADRGDKVEWEVKELRRAVEINPNESLMQSEV